MEAINFNKLTNNDINELIFMTDQLLSQFDRFDHVSSHYPENIKKDIEKVQKKLYKESDKRDL
jgi:glutathionyl-hydroquinone reductase